MARQADKEQAEEEKANNDFKTLTWDRSCTDTLVCLVFALFCATLVGITIYAVGNGDPYAMLTPFDSVGNQCGMTH